MSRTRRPSVQTVDVLRALAHEPRAVALRLRPLAGARHQGRLHVPDPHATRRPRAAHDEMGDDHRRRPAASTPLPAQPLGARPRRAARAAVSPHAPGARPLASRSTHEGPARPARRARGTTPSRRIAASGARQWWPSSHSCTMARRNGGSRSAARGPLSLPRRIPTRAAPGVVVKATFLAGVAGCIAALRGTVLRTWPHAAARRAHAGHSPGSLPRWPHICGSRCARPAFSSRTGKPRGAVRRWGSRFSSSAPSAGRSSTRSCPPPTTT